MAEVVQMSLKESDRYAVIVQVIERTMGQSDAARWLNISVRQVKRLAHQARNSGITKASRNTQYTAIPLHVSIPCRGP